ncbi:methionyl-tRNA synthetase [Actinoplanes octamycinicus]|uniref:methionine--tRNA ligase n=1 Tax=Actinoplanes octamycinicus TaxID=135948 RepID=A0A7W7MAG1_9ACTN|nr:methionine--tRNA ligase [Actinoplanes octamycinicus]MBB4743014.1 methionyl-tRNA synthetase [Actinoplanes octamycinicus]GIE58131.1 methionine--tRNA ligase [Actinoplanes octamycinicus]
MSFYVTTAIPYVNAAPHLGHALELVQADVLARHRRLRGEPVRFLTGTDDNALKNVTAAAAAGEPVAAFVARNADRFAGLTDALDLSFDDFIRTGSDPRHAPGVERLWQRTAARGDLYRRDYQGWYCAGCEQFVETDELCPEHGVAPERVTESNWFFRLSRYARDVLAALESGRVRIEPAARRNEVLAFVRAGLTDISVSRPASRAAGWGIPVPGDADQVVYVWWDALANYVTALGYGRDDPAYRKWWVESAERVHVIGKGIVRFHAVHWLALLLATGQPLPTTIFVHDYLTVDGVKLSKSAGNAVDPHELAGRFGADALRWWLLRDVAGLGDTDFTERRLLARYHQDLANGLGNLVNRTVSLAHRYRGGRVRALGNTGLGAALPSAIDRALDKFEFRAATQAIGSVVADANRLVEAERPWELAGGERFDDVLAVLVATCRGLAHELSPFLPAGAARLAAQLGTGPGVGAPQPVFPR